MVDLTAQQLLGFLLAAVLVTVAPGPDNLMVLSLGASRGRRAGVAFGLGCATGCLSHTLLAVLGVGVALAASPAAFTALRWAGGAYLVWLGLQALRSSLPATTGTAADAERAMPVSRDLRPDAAALRALFAKGLLANAINQKVGLFFLSFLPQFAVPAQGPVGPQLVALGLVFTAQAAALFGALGWFAGAVGGWLQRRPRAGAWLDRLAGAVFVGLGARLIAG